MAENSAIVLHWEIDNATARLATGKAESGVFYKKGFRWTAVVQRRPDLVGDKVDVILRCDSDDIGSWECEVDTGVYMRDSSGTYTNWIQERFVYNDNCNTWSYGSILNWFDLPASAYKIHDKVTMEFRIKIISWERDEVVDKTLFTAPNRKSNVMLKIGDKALHVSKELLAIHSPVFDTLFFGDFAEKGKEEVELKDVVYEEFIDILHLIYPGVPKITDRTVQYVLKLADQFQMEGLLKMSKNHLMQSSRLGVAKKLLLADQYRITSLGSECLQSFTTSNDIIKQLKSSPEYGNFSADMKVAILDQIMKLNLQ